MNEDAAAYGAEGGGVKVEGDIEVFPSGKEGERRWTDGEG